MELRSLSPVFDGHEGGSESGLRCGRMTVRYTVADADLLAVRRLHQSRPEGRREILREYISGFLAASVVLAAFFLIPRASRADLPLVALPILLGITFVLWTPFYLYLLRRADGRVVALRHESATGGHEMTLTAEGIQEVRPQGTVFHRWAFVNDVCDRPTHLFILVGQDGTYVVPKRDLSIEDRVSFPRAAFEFWRSASARPE